MEKQFTARNFIHEIDRLGVWDTLDYAGLIAEVVANYNGIVSRGGFDINEIITYPRKWPEFWVPALNHELEQDEANLDRTTSEWMCVNHYGGPFSRAFFENSVCISEGCSILYLGSGDKTWAAETED